MLDAGFQVWVLYPGFDAAHEVALFVGFSALCTIAEAQYAFVGLFCCSFLSPKETVTAALAQRLWRDVAYDGLIWKLHLLTDYGVERSQAPTGDMCPSHR